MPFCYAPWTNIDIDPAGQISPCCKFRRQYYNRTYNIQQDSIHDYVNSDLLASVKADFKNGQWPAGCERCRIEEQNKIASKRQLDWDRWQGAYQNIDLDQTEFITASVAFGNTCNLKCITCSSYASSRWQKEYKEIYNINWPHVKFYQHDFVKKFVELAPRLLHLDIPGGEPFLSGIDEQKKLLQHYIDSGKASDITLHYTTNATVFPDQSWWKLWENFKEIDLQFSIDGVGQRYEYIRYPADWNLVVSNVRQYINEAKIKPNVRLSVSHTVSAYNVYYLDEFVSWCYNIGLPQPWLGRVHTPVHMRPTVWSESAKTFIIDHLSHSSNDLESWILLMKDNDDSEHFEMFKTKLKQHDNYRQLNFSDSFPELSKFI